MREVMDKKRLPIATMKKNVSRFYKSMRKLRV